MPSLLFALPLYCVAVFLNTLWEDYTGRCSWRSSSLLSISLFCAYCTCIFFATWFWTAIPYVILTIVALIVLFVLLFASLMFSFIKCKNDCDDEETRLCLSYTFMLPIVLPCTIISAIAFGIAVIIHLPYRFVKILCRCCKNTRDNTVAPDTVAENNNAINNCDCSSCGFCCCNQSRRTNTVSIEMDNSASHSIRRETANNTVITAPGVWTTEQGDIPDIQHLLYRGEIESCDARIFTKIVAFIQKSLQPICSCTFSVRKIWRVKRTQTWRRYRSTLTHANQITPSPQLRSSPIRTNTWLDDELKQTLQLDPSKEVLLFHGIQSSQLSSIILNGVCMQHAARHGSCGRGLYFAESIQLADAYANRERPSQRIVLLCRVSLGKTRDFDSSPAVTGEDSVVASYMTNFREFMITEDLRCLPEFCVMYDCI